MFPYCTVEVPLNILKYQFGSSPTGSVIVETEDCTSHVPFSLPQHSSFRFLQAICKGWEEGVSLINLAPGICHGFQVLQYKVLRLLTYLLTPWSRVLLEKLTGSAASQEIPRILRNPNFHHRTHKCPPPALSWANSTQSPQPPPPHFLKIHLNIILPSMSGSPQWSLSLRFPHQNPVQNSPLRNTRHMPRPSHSSRFYHPHNIGYEYRSLSSSLCNSLHSLLPRPS